MGNGAAAPTVESSCYGSLSDGRPVRLFTLAAGSLRVRLLDYGALTIGVEVPDRDGRLADVTLGFATLDGWLHNPAYFGATVGRCANRIAGARFALDGRTYHLAANHGRHHLHGGNHGFDRKLWSPEPFQTSAAAGVRLRYRSPDGEEGYPGNLDVMAEYSVTTAGEFRAAFSATADRPTIVNLAHHTYWNLSGAAAGDVLGHELELNADQYTAVDGDLIPTGELAPVAGTPLDFTRPTAIGARIAQVPGGYDHNFVLRGASSAREGEAPAGPVALRLAARLCDPRSGRQMELHTDQPGVQFYSGNFLDGSLRGPGGVAYGRHHGLCLETQCFPDAPNHANFPSVVLRPGATYRHTMVHRFTTR